MDPYLEKPSLWPDLHHNLITEIQSTLNGGIRPKYFARVETRVYISDQDDPGRSVIVPDVRIMETPDAWKHGTDLIADEGNVAVAEPIVATTLFVDEIVEAYLEIRDTETHNVVTVIEVLSPTNKVPGARGMDSFRHKRSEVMASPSHYVEIDLLRSGERLMAAEALPLGDYFVHLSRVERRPSGFIWPIKLPHRLPVIPIPLRNPDPDVKLDLQKLLNAVYDRCAYDLDTDYSKEPSPPLPPQYHEWPEKLLRTGAEITVRCS